MSDSESNKQEGSTQEQPKTNADTIKNVKLAIKAKPGVDTDDRWVKKAGKLRFGFKQHIGTD